MPNKREHIFISYASEDESKARAFSKILKDKGIEPWLDKERLMLGQPWKDEIVKAIRSARAVIFLCSVHSVNKSGFVQRELKEILEQLKEVPTGDIFVMVVRLDNTEPRDLPLLDIQWVDMFSEPQKAFADLQQALFKVMQDAARQLQRQKESADIISANRDGEAKDGARAKLEADAAKAATMKASNAREVFFKPEELDIYCNKVTLDAYIFHGKEVDYSKIEHLVYDGDDQSVKVILQGGESIDLGVKIQWLIRPYFEKAREVQMVRTHDGVSIDGTVLQLRKIGDVRFSTVDRYRAPKQRSKFVSGLLNRFKRKEGSISDNKWISQEDNKKDGR